MWHENSQKCWHNGVFWGFKLCTGNEDTPVVVDDVKADEDTGETSDVNADEGAGESSDKKSNNIHLQPCNCVLLLLGMFWTQL